ncbi:MULTISPECIES: sensor histidine kinase [Bacillaceae]|uniref:sensor histidine kinase n=1 Tax=Bacillaceae TaxID=186817 RepID=UPI000AD89CBE|nr:MULTISPECIES: HAMP domain-containing sensor histidine kinase [Bacillaceae]
MIIGLLVCSIGLSPLLVSFVIKSMYNNSSLSSGLFLYLSFITIWQLDIGSLYFLDTFSESTILWLFKVLRIGPTFGVPIVLYLAYKIIKDQPTMLKETDWLLRVSRVLLTKKSLIFFTIWSGVLYVINLTNLGISGLTVEKAASSSFYYPVYGPLGWIFIAHMFGFIIFVFLVFLISRKISNPSFRNLLTAISLASIWLIILGLFNFSPAMGAITSSIGVIIFSISIFHFYVKLNTSLKESYYDLMERQKKLDYTGNLAGSLIHEVKNTNQIIKSFSNLLSLSGDLNDTDKRTLDMIQKSSDHLGKLTNNYKDYMKSSNLVLKKENLMEVIEESINLSSEMLRTKQVDIEFQNKYQPLITYVNRTNLEQVFINLIKNSVEAMPEDRANKKIMITTELKNELILIHFIDTGKGIPPANWESVFDPFISIDKRGMGLGLPFVKKTIIEHLGTISITESCPEGTHFIIELPQNGILDMMGKGNA